MRTRDLGSAKEGVKRWWKQRISSVAVAPLALWLVFSLAQLPDFSYFMVQKWFAIPLNTFLMLAFIIIAYYHMALGLRVIMEDYIHLLWLKVVSIVAMELITFILVLISAVAVMKLFF